MKLEQEIQQSKFRSEKHKLAVNLAFTHFWVLDQLRMHLKPFDISMQQFNVLRILRGQHPKPATINLIRDRMLDKSSDVSRMVERLRLKGLVDRNPCPEDRRSVDILITTKGLEVLKSIDSHESEFDSIFNALTEEEAKTVNTLLDKLRE